MINIFLVVSALVFLVTLDLLVVPELLNLNVNKLDKGFGQLLVILIKVAIWFAVIAFSQASTKKNSCPDYQRVNETLYRIKQ